MKNSGDYIYQNGQDSKLKTTYEKLIFNNRIWVDRKLTDNPNFFSERINGQQPAILWIGCADSCVSVEEITGTSGEIFIYHNMANMVIHNDMNMLSVLDYAVNILSVNHVVVCGHYQCASIKVAMEDQELGIISHWVSHIRDVYRLHKNELDSVTDFNERWKRFIELNVIEQMLDLSKSTIIRDALKKRQLEIHGCVYDQATGLINSMGTLFRNRKS